MQKKEKIILFGLVLLCLSSLAWAYPYDTGLLGGLEKDILDTLSNILSYKITLPGWGPVPTQVIPLWALVAMFAVLFSIIYPLSITVIPIFKEEKFRNPAKAFSIAISFLVILGTKFPTIFYKYITASTGLLLIGLLLWLAFLFWEYGIRSPLRKFKPLRTSEEIKAIHDEKLALNAERKLYQSDEQLLKNAENDIKDILNKEKDLIGKIRKIKDYIITLNEVHKRRGPQAVKEYINKLKTEISKIVNELKITLRDYNNLEKDWEKIIKNKEIEIWVLDKEYEEIKNNIQDSILKEEMKEIFTLNDKLKEQLDQLKIKHEQIIQIEVITDMMNELIKELGVGDLEKAFQIVVNLESQILNNERMLEKTAEIKNKLKDIQNKLDNLIKKVSKKISSYKREN
ncbi:MAG: hypothetical protein QXU20_01140 [Candidatus Woesearchaeota archaeon]